LENGKSPPVLPTSEKPHLNVELLNDARTKPADFFSILLGGVRTCSLFSSLKNGVGKIGGTGPKL
jgi:hypothetical protein